MSASQSQNSNNVTPKKRSFGEVLKKIDTTPKKKVMKNPIEYNRDGLYKVTLAAKYDKYGQFVVYTLQSNDFLDKVVLAMGEIHKFGKTAATIDDHSATILKTMVSFAPPVSLVSSPCLTFVELL